MPEIYIKYNNSSRIFFDKVIPVGKITISWHSITQKELQSHFHKCRRAREISLSKGFNCVTNES